MALPPRIGAGDGSEQPVRAELSHASPGGIATQPRDDLLVSGAFTRLCVSCPGGAPRVGRPSRGLEELVSFWSFCYLALRRLRQTSARTLRAACSDRSPLAPPHWDFKPIMKSQTHTQPTGTDSIGAQPSNGEHADLQVFHEQSRRAPTP
jgi:hypothetical protein